MDHELDRILATFAAQQHAVFTRRDTDALGFTRRQRELRAERGHWLEPFEGVYRIAGAPRTWRAELLCAVFAGWMDEHQNKSLEDLAEALDANLDLWEAPAVLPPYTDDELEEMARRLESPF